MAVYKVSSNDPAAMLGVNLVVEPNESSGNFHEWLLTFPNFNLLWVITPMCFSKMYQDLVPIFVSRLKVGMHMVHFTKQSEVITGGDFLRLQEALVVDAGASLVQNQTRAIVIPDSKWLLNTTDLIVANPQNNLSGETVAWRIFNPRESNCFALREGVKETQRGVDEMLSFCNEKYGNWKIALPGTK